MFDKINLALDTVNSFCNVVLVGFSLILCIGLIILALQYIAINNSKQPQMHIEFVKQGKIIYSPEKNSRTSPWI